MQQLERRRDRWVSAGLSVLLHGALIGVLIYGWWTFRHQPKPPPTLAIDATVVSPKSLKGGPAGVERKPSPQPPPPLQTVSPPAQAAQPQTVTPPPHTTPPPSLSDDQTVPSPPKATPDHTAELKAKQEAEQKAEAEAQQKAADRKAEQEEEKRAAAEAAAQRKAKEAEVKKRAEQQRLAEAKRKAEEQHKAEEQRLAQNQAELAQSVAADEKLLAERSGPAMASWAQLVTAKITRAWIRPPSARPGIDCFIDITQVPGGQVTTVKVGSCNGDEAVRQSIQDAAYRASPLPQPSDPSLFQREFQVEFKPTE